LLALDDIQVFSELLLLAWLKPEGGAIRSRGPIPACFRVFPCSASVWLQAAKGRENLLQRGKSPRQGEAFQRSARRAL